MTSAIKAALLKSAIGVLRWKTRTFVEGTEMPDHTDLLTSEELATELKVSESWVRDHAAGRRRPVLPSYNLGSKRKPTYRFNRQVIQEWLNGLAGK